MELKLLGEKIRKIRTEAHHLLATPNVPARSLAQFLGKLNATTPALQMAPLFCRSLQIFLRKTLVANYQSTVKLSPQAIEDLQWWEQHLTSWNGRSLTYFPSLHNGNRLQCFTAGLGSHLQREIGKRSLVPPGADSAHQLPGTSGSYSGSLNLCQGKIKHLNTVENRQHNCSSIYKQKRGDSVPNTFASGKDPVAVVHGEISLEAQHLPEVMNSIADRESRAWLDRTEWKLLTQDIPDDQFPARFPFNRPICKPVSSQHSSVGSQILWPWQQMHSL